MRKLASVLFLLLAVTANAQVGPTSGGGGSVSSGSAIGSCTSSILYTDASTLLGCNPAAVTNGSVSTAGRSILTIRDTITGASATSNFLNITGAMPASLSAETSSILFSIAGNGGSQISSGVKISMSGNTAGGYPSYALKAENLESGTYTIGVKGVGNAAASGAVGVVGQASGATNKIGGYFALADQDPPSTSSALVIDNVAVAANIFEARDNGTPVFTIADGGASTFASAVTFSSQTNLANLALAQFGPNSAWTTVYANTALTPDAAEFLTGTAANAIPIAEYADNGFDFQNPCTTGLGTAACTDPTLIIHSHNQDTGEFLSMAHDGKAGVIVGGNSTVLDGTIRLGGTVTLTESSATAVLTVPVAVSTGTGGEIIYTVEARDATNTQIRAGKVLFAVANNSGGTETCNVFGISTTQAVGGDTTNAANPTQVQDGSGVGAITSGTLTYAWSVDTTGSNQCVLKLNAVSSLTQTTLQVHYTVIQSGPGISTGGD